MTEICRKTRICVFLAACLFLPSQVFADESYFELTPSIHVSESYDDNITLDPVEKKSDYLSTVSPTIGLNSRSENRNLEFTYAPTFVRYEKETENNTVRHAGTVTYDQDLTGRLRFNLTDTYLKTEDPIEEIEEVETVRTSRRTYQRNQGRAGLEYLFGPENRLSLGYEHSLLKNEDVTVDGESTHTPFVGLTYWFDVKQGMELDYRFTKADFTGEGDAGDENDHIGHDIGASYIYRFSEQTRGSLRYDLSDRRFEGLSEDYQVHQGSIGFERALSPYLSLALGGGWFKQEMERSEGQSGFSYNASLTRDFENGRFSLGGLGGWDEAYIDVERQGFSRYWSADTQFQYQLLERLNSHVGASYRRDKDEESMVWETLQGNIGLDWNPFRLVTISLGYFQNDSTEFSTMRRNCAVSWEFHRWFALSLNYSYTERDDDDDEADFSVNRVMLTLTGRKMFRW